MKLVTFACLAAALCAGGAARADEEFGHFEGDLIFQAVGAEGREMKVLAPFAYVGPDERKWSVPPGTVVDGASIPSAFWSVIGAPYSGQYREASVVHDYYCKTRERGWEDVHLAFYNGMRAKGVGYLKAQTMYAAVYAFGPRWIVATDDRGNEISLAGRLRPDEAAKDKLIGFAGNARRSAAEISAYADGVLQVSGPDEAEERIRKEPDCGPVISSGEDTGSVYLLCDLDRSEKRFNAKRNLDILVRDLRKLYASNTFILVPTLERYRTEPSEANWKEAKEEMARTRNLVKIAILSTLDYDASLVASLGSATARLYGVLQTRSIMLDELQTGPPAAAAQLDAWIERYRSLIMQLGEELAKLQADLTAQP